MATRIADLDTDARDRVLIDLLDATIAAVQAAEARTTATTATVPAGELSRG